VGLLSAAKKRYRHYSLGMKQRLAISAGLLRPRELIILDEPTNGLDPQGTREVRALIRQIAADGTTVFVSSHLLAEVEQICTHVGVMRSGQLVFQGSLPELRRTGATRVTVQTADPEAAVKVFTALGLPDARVSASPDRSAPPAAAPHGPSAPAAAADRPAAPAAMDPSLAPALMDPSLAPAAAEWPPAPAAAADRPSAPGLGPGQSFAEASAVLGDAAPERICAELVQAGIGVRGFAVTSPSLEDLFVGLTGEGFDV
jgi:ABC-2 type transport system ATP-binding protein